VIGSTDRLSYPKGREKPARARPSALKWRMGASIPRAPCVSYFLSENPITSQSLWQAHSTCTATHWICGAFIAVESQWAIDRQALTTGLRFPNSPCAAPGLWPTRSWSAHGAFTGSSMTWFTNQVRTCS